MTFPLLLMTLRTITLCAWLYCNVFRVSIYPSAILLVVLLVLIKVFSSENHIWLIKAHHAQFFRKCLETLSSFAMALNDFLVFLIVFCIFFVFSFFYKFVCSDGITTFSRCIMFSYCCRIPVSIFQVFVNFGTKDCNFQEVSNFLNHYALPLRQSAFSLLELFWCLSSIRKEMIIRSS